MKDNNFRLETEGQHMERAGTMANGIAEYGVELGFSPDEPGRNSLELVARPLLRNDNARKKSG